MSGRYVISFRNALNLFTCFFKCTRTQSKWMRLAHTALKCKRPEVQTERWQRSVVLIINFVEATYVLCIITFSHDGEVLCSVTSPISALRRFTQSRPLFRPWCCPHGSAPLYSIRTVGRVFCMFIHQRLVPGDQEYSGPYRSPSNFNFLVNDSNDFDYRYYRVLTMVYNSQRYWAFFSLLFRKIPDDGQSPKAQYLCDFDYVSVIYGDHLSK
jgi:hypothetical protein